jgi:hypothetical protein
MTAKDFPPPGYVAVVEKMCALIPEWCRAQATAPDLRWIDSGDTIITGSLRGEALKYLADSPDAYRLLEWLDEQTGHEGTLFQATMALRFLGHLPGGPERQAVIESFPKAIEAYAFGNGTTTHMPPQACPRCGKMLDANDGEKDHVPQPGSFTVCVVCAALHQFSDEMRLQPVTPEAFAELPTDFQDEIASIQTLIVLARTRVGTAKHGGEA